MCGNHRLFECKRKGQTQNDAGYDLRRKDFKHRYIVYRRGVVQHEYQRHEQRVCDDWRKGCKQWAAAQKIRSHRADERCKRTEHHIEHTEWREKEVCEKTTYRKSGDRFGEDNRQQNENFGYAKLHGTERNCAQCDGKGKIQSGDNSRSCRINKRFFQNAPRFFLLMGIADTIASMLSYKK